MSKETYKIRYSVASVGGDLQIRAQTKWGNKTVFRVAPTEEQAKAALIEEIKGRQARELFRSNYPKEEEVKI